MIEFKINGKPMPTNVHPTIEGGQVTGYIITKPSQPGDWEIEVIREADSEGGEL